MKLTSARKNKLQDIIDNSTLIFVLICIFCVTATIISIVMYIQYRDLLSACEVEDLKKVDELEADLVLTSFFGVLWSLTKVALIVYAIYLVL